MIVSRTFFDGMCTSDNMNYIDYTTFPIENSFPLDTCIPLEGEAAGFYQMNSAQSCSSTGQITVNIFNDAGCTNMVGSDSVFGYECSSGDDDDADDDDDDDDDFETVGVTSNEFCT
jgi:hypothetical protein